MKLNCWERCHTKKNNGPMDDYQEDQFWKFTLGGFSAQLSWVNNTEFLLLLISLVRFIKTCLVVMPIYRNDVVLQDFILFQFFTRLFLANRIIADATLEGGFTIQFLWTHLLCWFPMAAMFYYYIPATCMTKGH